MHLIFLGLMINTSSSMPLGIYHQTTKPIQRGDIVAICLPRDSQQYGLKRHYLRYGSTCKGSESLIKRILAVPGDSVTLTDNHLIVNGLKYSYQTRHQDTNGRSLKIYPRGHYPKTLGYWLIGTNNPHSWDSRYWGPISSKYLLAHLEGLILKVPHKIQARHCEHFRKIFFEKIRYCRDTLIASH